MMDHSIDIDKALKRVQSASTIYSEPLTFHSLRSTSPQPLESVPTAWIEGGLLQRERSDSGYSESTMDMAEVEKNAPAPTKDLSDPTPLRTTLNEPATLWVRTDEQEAVSVSDNQFSKIPNKRTATTPLPESMIIRSTSSRRSSASGPSGTASQHSRNLSQTSTAKRPPYQFSGPRTKSATMRSSSSMSARQYFEDPYIVHHRARQLFQCLTPTSIITEPQEALLPSPDLTSPSTHARHRTVDSNSSYETIGPRAVAEPPCTHALSTVIDWTVPTTRRREYAKIDRSTRGLRGLWRKVTPRWCRGGGRMTFYEGKNDDDRGSVRRYRLDILDEVDEKGHQSSSDGRTRSWNCFTTKAGRQ